MDSLIIKIQRLSDTKTQKCYKLRIKKRMQCLTSIVSAHIVSTISPNQTHSQSTRESMGRRSCYDFSY